MIKEYKIKGMICSRCIKVLTMDMLSNGVHVKQMDLGRVVLEFDPRKTDENMIEKILLDSEFEIIRDKSEVIAEETKKWIIDYIWNTDGSMILSRFLENKMILNYPALSKIFSKVFGRTIERFTVLLKVERTKEYIENEDLNFSEIAYLMGYQNPSALSRQFKQETGLTMSNYKSLGVTSRIPIDRI